MPAPAVAPPESHRRRPPVRSTVRTPAASTSRVRGGRVTKIDGSTENHDHRRLHLREGAALRRARLRRRPAALSGGPHAARRAQGQFKRVTWDDALDLIAERMRDGARAAAGGEAILPLCYGGSNGLLTQDNVDAHPVPAPRRVAAGAHRVRGADRRGEPGALRQDAVGHLPGLSRREADRRSGASTRRRLGHSPGAVSSRRRATTAPRSSSSIRARPRSRGRPTCTWRCGRAPTLPVALALHRYLFEDGHADQAFLDEHTHGAERAARAGAAVDVRARRRGQRHRRRRCCGRSPSSTRRRRRRSSGAAGASSAIATAAAPRWRCSRCRRSAGKFGVRGGGYSMSNSASWNIERTWIDRPGAADPRVNMNQLGRALTEPEGAPVKVLFVYNCNPAATAARSAPRHSRPRARGPVHRGLRPGDDRHARSTPTWCCRRRPSSSTTTSRRATARSRCSSAGR